MATELVSVLSAVICAPISTTLRGIATKVAVGVEEGLREAGEIACDALLTIHEGDLDTVPLGFLSAARFDELDRAMARALDIRRAHLPLA
jgi:mRNA interferase MazF